MSRIVVVANPPSLAAQWRNELASIGGHQIEATVSDAREARSLLSLHQPQLVVCGLRLRDGTAIAMIQWLASLPQRPTIVAVVQDDFDALAFEALRAGADNLCWSGDAPGAVATSVAQTLQGETSLTPATARALFDHFERSHALLGRTIGDEQSPLQLEPGQRELLMRLAAGYRVEQVAQAQQTTVRTLGQRLRTVVRKMQWDLRAGSLSLQLR